MANELESVTPAGRELAGTVLEAFTRHRLVGIGGITRPAEPSRRAADAAHRPAALADIVVEFGNARYQDTVDRFIARGPVADAGLRMVWRNTMQSPRQTWDAPVYEQLARNTGSQRDICPAAGSRQRPSAERPADPGDRPAARGCAGPGRIAVPYHSAARWRIRRRRTIRTLSDNRAHPAQPSITTAPGLAAGADRTTHSNEKRLLSISKSHRAPIRRAWLKMLVRMTVAHITANYGHRKLGSMRRLCGIVHSIQLTERTVAADGRKRRYVQPSGWVYWRSSPKA